MQIPRKGSLTDVSFIEILIEYTRSDFTGMARLENASIIKVAYLQSGNVAFASSNEKSDRLTEVLKNARKLTPEQVEDAQSRLRPNVSLGKTLVELGYISARDLLWGARAQVDQILHKLLFWKEGAYQILDGPLPKEIISLNLPIPQVIFEGILWTQDRQWVLDHIESPEAIYSLSADFHDKYSAYKLPADTIVSRIDGKRSLDEVAQLAGLDTFETCKMVAALQILGLAERAPEPFQLALEQREISENQSVEEFESEDLTAPEREKENPQSDLSLGQVLQIPTVEELEREQKEEVAAASAPPLVPVPEPFPKPEPPAAQEAPPPPAHPIKGLPEAPSERPLPSAKEKVKLEPAVYITRNVPLSTMHSPSPSGRLKYIVAIVAILVTGAAASYYLYQTRTHGNSGEINIRSTVQPESEKPSAPENAEQPGQISGPAPLLEIKKESSPSTAVRQQSVKPSATQQPPLTLFKGEKLAEAAQGWRRELLHQRSKLTIQLLIACQEKTVTDTFEALGYSKQLSVVPIDFKGQSCYRVLFGVYASQSDAQSARSGLPPSLLQQSSPPQVVPLSKVLR